MEKQKKKILLIVGIVLAVVLFAGVYVLYQKLSSKYQPQGIGTENNSAKTQQDQDTETDSGDAYRAPDILVFDENGREVRLSDYVGKPVVLNFWASWCPPCKSEMPHFEEAYKTYPQVQFLMVNSTDTDTMSEAKQLIEENAYTFPVFYDNDGSAARIYRVYSLPQTFFIDSQGNLVTYAMGALGEEDLKKELG